MRLVRRVGRQRPDAEQGAAAVEFALVLPLLVLVIFGILQFGLYFYRYQGLQSLAHEGARGGSVGLTVQEIEDRVEAAMSIPADYNDVEIRVILTDQTTGTDVYDIDAKTGDDAVSGTGGFLSLAPCEALANPRDYTLRVFLALDETIDDYKIIIPIWGNVEIDYGSQSTFTCEAVA